MTDWGNWDQMTLEQRVEQLKKALDRWNVVSAPLVAALERQVADLERRVKALEDAPAC